MKIQFVVQPKSGLSYHRLINPMEFMNWTEGDSGQMLWVTQDEHLIDGDILYYNKFITMDASMILNLKKKGIKVVVDIDDSWELPTNHLFYDYWNMRGNTQKVISNIEIADLVICATDKLQQKVRTLNKNTAVIPNAFPFGHDVYVPNQIKGRKKMAFIYAAGSTHLPDVELLRGKFKRMGGDPFIKNNAEFILAGYEPTLMPKYKTKEDYNAQNNNFTMTKVNNVWDKMSSIFSQTNCNRILPSTNLDEYINYYDQADVALIPLCNTEWNSYKSELKIIEAAVKGIPVICSAVEPYSKIDMPQGGIMWVFKPDDWLKHIKFCIQNPEFVKEQGAILHEWAKERYDLIKWNETRSRLFKSLMNK